jgi:N-acetylneuraminate synthase/N,N'-diacetyllegionaminate synthase
MIQINRKKIGYNQPCFIIAEAGVNHNGDIEIAKRLIDGAVEAGADAIKFQTFNADLLVTPDAEKAQYQKKGTPALESQYQMIKRLELSPHTFKKLSDYANMRKIIFFSSPFDMKSVDILERIEVPLYKIPSGEITNLPLLTYIAKKGKPIILSTGMATFEEIDEAINIIKNEGVEDIILLYCVTSYPAKMESLDLNVISSLRNRYHLPVGFSDHTTGIVAAIAARTLNACVIEKHFTLDRKMSGPDHKASIDPKGLKKLVMAIREIESALGNGMKKISKEEREIKAITRKSLVAAIDISAGTIITEIMIDLKRPGTGLAPKYKDKIIGKKSNRSIKKNELFDWDMME